MSPFVRTLIFTIVAPGFWTLAMPYWLLPRGAGANLFVLLYGEPVLRRKFGAEYEDYCCRVPRWLPHF